MFQGSLKANGKVKKRFSSHDVVKIPDTLIN